MKAWFDEQEVEWPVLNPLTHGPTGKVAKEKKVFFHLRKPQAGSPAVDFEFDGPATDKHKKDYSSQFQEFLDSKKVVKKEESSFE